MKFIKRAFGEFNFFLYEMTMSVIFCLSYDLSQWLFTAFKVDIFSTKNALLLRTSS